MNMNSATPHIHLANVGKTFALANGQSVNALSHLDLSINRGEWVSIVGKSGSGKSTLLNLITGIDQATTGAITIGGQTLDNLSESLLTRWRGRNVGIVFQFFQLMTTLTVLEKSCLRWIWSG